MDFDIPKLKKETLEEGTVIHTIDEDGIMTIILNRPRRSNSFLIGMYYVMMDYIIQGCADSNVKVILLRGI